MGDLVRAENNAPAPQTQNTPAVQIMMICRVVTSQFYKGFSQADLKAEKEVIELLTAHIDAAVMKKMCELAVQNYGTARSDNNKTYFDVNYVLTFYRAAFNWCWCESVKIPKDAHRAGDTYDEASRVMLNSYTRRQIEWHFKNYEADAKLYVEQERNICESGMSVNMSFIGSRSNISQPTEAKAFKLLELTGQQNWATVVRNTFLSFKFEPEYDIMVALYVDNLKPAAVINDFFNGGKWETTFWRWRDKWLERAYEWARTFDLL